MTGVLIEAERALIDGEARGATAVLAVDGEIAVVGDPAQVAADPRAAGVRRLDWSGRALIPGTINAHNHSFQSLLRGIGDDLPFLEWREKALYRYSPGLGPAEMETAALFAFGEMLLHGVTTVCDFYYLNHGGNDNALATIGAARRLGMRIVLARSFYDWEGAPAAYRERVPQAVANFEALHARFAGEPRRLVGVQPAPHSLHGASPDMIVAGAGCARAAGSPWHIHLAEERYQVDDALARFGARPVHAVAALGVLDASMIAVHGCWFDDGERALLAERGAALAYNPASNMFLGDGITDVVDLRRRGVRVALGTDGGCSNNRVSVLDEIRMTALLQKVARTDGQAITAEDCLAMGTRMGGEVLGLPVGRVAPGYRCDLVALDLGDPSLWPVQALAKNVVYALSSRAIRDVVVDGEVVVENRRLVHVAQEEIESRVRRLTGDWRREG
ncbi:MAG TPA: amidohydrolase family protein [Kofleriaceae bacterium]|nr:amidohydrolase family protein [Kofleriaceae bacterium]